MTNLSAESTMAFLTGIANHARAGNYEQAELQAVNLIEALESVPKSAAGWQLYQDALRYVRALPEQLRQHDRAAVIASVHSAVEQVRLAPDES